MLLQTILYGEYTPPDAPVTRSHRIMNQVTFIDSRFKRGFKLPRKQARYELDKLTENLTDSWQTASILAAKTNITLNAFYQKVRKLKEQGLVEVKTVSRSGNVRYRYYRKTQCQ
jgi:DNA-binding transcriptional ArsR family regulator